MTKAEQKKLFMEFYGVTPELKKWAREKWASGTASLSKESLDYMEAELIIRKRKAEAAAEAAKILEQENARVTGHTGANKAVAGSGEGDGSKAGGARKARKPANRGADV